MASPPRIYGDGNQTRDFVYVDDVAKANYLAAINEVKELNTPINIASGKEVSINQLVQYINELLGTEIKPVYTSERKGDVLRSWGDISLAKSLLGWEPKIDIKEGLRRTIEYYKNKR